jgi:hypothetical protein
MSSVAPPRSYSKKWFLIVAALFAFRLLFGLLSEFFFEDETQIFLMGLRYYATGHWPFFGPDVVWTRSEIPGALQPLLVGVPLKLFPVPEAPFVLLNLLSTGALAALAWYVCERLPSMPRWLVWGWFLTAPWTLQYSTHITNPSYVLPAAILFFLGFFETVPVFRLGRITPAKAHFMMGVALTWIMQIHLSWPLLLPYAALAWLSRRKDGLGSLAMNAGAFAAGAAIPALLLLPTLLRYGGQAGSGGTISNLHVHWVNPWIVVTTLARFFSFASLEINRFIAIDGAKRLMFFASHAWLAPAAAVVWLAGIAQPVWMLLELRRRAPKCPEWRALRWLAAGSVLLVYASYWFVMEPPQAHAFYAMAPIALVYAAYCWSFIDSPRWRKVAAAVLVLNIVFHGGLRWAQAGTKSMYRNRAVVMAAIQSRQPEMLGHRRPFAIDAGPYSLQDPSRPYDARRDLQLVASDCKVALGRALLWTVSVRNTNGRVAFRDLLYITTYRDESGRVLEERHELIKDILQPGDVMHREVNDGYARPFASATFEIVAAEALVPIR